MNIFLILQTAVASARSGNTEAFSIALGNGGQIGATISNNIQSLLSHSLEMTDDVIINIISQAQPC